MLAAGTGEFLANPPVVIKNYQPHAFTTSSLHSSIFQSSMDDVLRLGVMDQTGHSRLWRRRLKHSQGLPTMLA